MIAQFRNRYPNGHLISELLAIDHGKYIVRALVQVEGITFATGLAAAETVESAEDQARQRALAVLGPEMNIRLPRPDLEPSTPAASPLNPAPLPNLSEPEFTSSPTSELASTSEREAQPLPSEDWLSATYLNPDSSKQKSKKSNLETPESFSKGRTASLPFLPQNELDTVIEPQPVVEEQPMTPAPRSSKSQKLESQDFSSDIAKTDIELNRLGWTPEQGAAHLQKTYGKRSRRLLTEEELLDFLHYLESLPSPTPLDEG